METRESPDDLRRNKSSILKPGHPKHDEGNRGAQQLHKITEVSIRDSVDKEGVSGGWNQLGEKSNS